MKLFPFLAAGAFALATTTALRADYTVYAARDTASAVVGTLPTGTSIPTPGSDGWAAVTVPAGPVTGWVRNRDIGKDLEVKPGASVFAEMRDDAAVAATVAAGDRVRIDRVEADWSRVRFEPAPKPGFVLATPPAAEPPPPALLDGGPSILPAPAAPPAATPGQPGVPRIFSGTFRPTRRILGFGPSYPYHLVDAGGRRVALLDVRNLLVMGDLAAYVDRTVTVRGVAVPTDTGKDVVVVVDTLTLQ